MPKNITTVSEAGRSARLKLKKAALNGTGTQLTPAEVAAMYFFDDAIKTVCDNEDGWLGKNPGIHGNYMHQKATRSSFWSLPSRNVSDSGE